MAWPTWTAATRSVAAAFGALLLLAALLRVPHARLADQSGSARSDSESLAQATCVDRAAGPVLDGYDVVAYHSLNADAAAVAGSSSYTATVFGYTWYFASEANRDLFEAAPLNYAPQWGGFCAYGIADEDWWTKGTLGPQADPDRWLLSDGKLYLFRGRTPRTWFEDDLTANVELGNARWESWFNATLAWNTDCFFFIDDDDDANAH